MRKFLLFQFLLFGSILFYQCNPKKADNQIQSVQDVTSQKSNYKLEQVWATDTLLKTPESVIYDKAREVIYASNVNQNPWEKDGNGFISKISKTGEILDLEWVRGMSGPKGMAIVGNTLYVADLDELVLIDLEGGTINKKLKIDGASGLNDITPGENGKIYISDSNEGKIFQYENGEVSIFHSDAPGRPNGLLMVEGKLLVAFSQASKFVSYDLNTLEKTVIAEQIGAGDGITPTNESGTYLISDWNGEITMISRETGKQSLLNTKKEGKNTADIWFIQEENLLLVPTFFDNRVVAYRVVKE